MTQQDHLWQEQGGPSAAFLAHCIPCLVVRALLLSLSRGFMLGQEKFVFGSDSWAGGWQNCLRLALQGFATLLFAHVLALAHALQTLDAQRLQGLLFASSANVSAV